ncbi:MAG: flagellar biosynthesis protein, partial [Proteobacteria bacterium]|nr:flagellar biosynthesis protein [Pseudomonadota bacterium]
MTTNSSKGFRNVPPPQGNGPARPASPYSRFIPREELGQFAAWSPDTLNTELDSPAAPAAADAAAP